MRNHSHPLPPGEGGAQRRVRESLLLSFASVADYNSRNLNCFFFSGHSLAMMLYITVSR